MSKEHKGMFLRKIRAIVWEKVYEKLTGGGRGGGKRNNLKPIQCVTDWRAWVQDPSTTLPTLEQSSIKNYDY